MEDNSYAFRYRGAVLAEGNAIDVADAAIRYVRERADDSMFHLADIDIVCAGEIVTAIPGELAGFVQSYTYGVACVREVADDGRLVDKAAIMIDLPTVRTIQPVYDTVGSGDIDAICSHEEAMEACDREAEVLLLMDKRLKSVGFTRIANDEYEKGGRRYRVFAWGDCEAPTTFVGLS